jgi:hypothetical protein
VGKGKVLKIRRDKMSLSVQELAKVDFPFVIVVHPDGKLSIGKPPSGEALETGNGSDVYQGQSDLLSIESGGTARDIGLSQNFQAPAETEPHSQSTESLRLLNRQKIIFFLTWSGSILITLITAILFFLSRGHLECNVLANFFFFVHGNVVYADYEGLLTFKIFHCFLK